MKNSNNTYYDEYNPWTISKNFLQITDRSRNFLINKILGRWHFLKQDIQHNTIKEYRWKKALIDIFSQYLEENNPSILEKNIKHPIGKKILQNLQSMDYPDIIYNIHHHKKLLENWYLINQMRLDILDKVTYPFDAIQHKNVRRFRDYLNYTLLYQQEDKDHFEQCINLIKKGNNIIILMNHPTYFTPGIIWGELERINKESEYPIENINQYFYTIVWPALTTNSQWSLWQGSSHILKTHPRTANGTINQIESNQQKAIKKFIDEILRLSQETTIWSYWKVFFIAPPWTKDTIAREGNNNNTIFFGNDDTESVKKTLQLTKIITKKNPNTSILMTWVNESNLKNPNYVNPLNHERLQDCFIPINTKLLSYQNIEEYYTLIKEKKIMPTIASMIKNINNENIWYAVPQDELEFIKKELTQKQSIQPSK